MEDGSVRWRIYYGDGSTLSHSDCSPFDAPPSNVQVVVIDRGDGKGPVLIQGKDAIYWKDSFGWCGCDVPGMYDYLQQYVGPKALLFGRSLRDAEFYAIVGRAAGELLG